MDESEGRYERSVCGAPISEAPHLSTIGDTAGLDITSTMGGIGRRGGGKDSEKGQEEESGECESGNGAGHRGWLGECDLCWVTGDQNLLTDQTFYTASDNKILLE